MKNTIFLFLFLAATATAQSGLSVQASELKALAGPYGSGTLTYRDYTSDETVSMPLSAQCKVSGKNLDLRLALRENGRVYKQHYQYQFNGATVESDGQWTLIEKAFDPANGTYRFLLTSAGIDGNDHKPCTFRVTITADSSRLTVRKEVKFDDAAAFFVRNEYVMLR